MDIISIGKCEYCKGVNVSWVPELDLICCRKIADSLEEISAPWQSAISRAKKTRVEKKAFVKHVLEYFDILDSEHEAWALED